MRILTINCGSSTLKFQLIEVATRDSAREHERRLASGTIDKIGSRGTIRFAAEGGEGLQEAGLVSNHGEATRLMLRWLSARGLLGSERLDAVGHRVVHGGNHFAEPVLIDDKVIGTIRSVSLLAPLHNEPSLDAICTAREVLGLNIPQVATFDTAFHSSLPEFVCRYAIPLELAEKHRIRRYGFHGLAHRYMTERYAAITSTPMERTNLITLQLGNGCSATAVKGGRTVDTSMGFTPLEGLMMGTRSGDLDPSLVGFIARQEAVDVPTVEKWFNTRSGLLGISGRSGDMRELLEAEAKGDTRAALAVAMFCYRVRKYIGSYMAVLGGADAVIFGGGIGENSPQVRARICGGMEWCGLHIDEKQNALVLGSEAKISTDTARVHAYVIPVDEGVIIARDTARCLQSH